MATPKGTHFVISANLLRTGASCWRCKDGTWTTDLQQAHPVATEAERDELLATAQKEEKLVADPFAFPVRIEGSAIAPLTAREQIRATGPTVAYRRPDRAA